MTCMILSYATSVVCLCACVCVMRSLGGEKGDRCVREC